MTLIAAVCDVVAVHIIRPWHDPDIGDHFESETDRGYVDGGAGGSQEEH